MKTVFPLSSRFFVKSDGNVLQLETSSSIPVVKYDSVVDRSSFRPFSETARTSVLSGSGFTSKGMFDDLSNPPSDVSILARSGKLDKAEIDDYIRAEKARVDESLSKQAKADELNAKLQEIEKAVSTNAENKIGVNNG